VPRASHAARSLTSHFFVGSRRAHPISKLWNRHISERIATQGGYSSKEESIFDTTFRLVHLVDVPKLLHSSHEYQLTSSRVVWLSMIFQQSPTKERFGVTSFLDKKTSYLTLHILCMTSCLDSLFQFFRIAHFRTKRCWEKKKKLNPREPRARPNAKIPNA
jgi:hypothetical protein